MYVSRQGGHPLAESGQQYPSIEDLADSLAPPDERILHRLFAAIGARAPRIVWDPTEAELYNPLIKGFATACRDAAGADGALPMDAASRPGFDGFRDWIPVVDCEDDGARFRYRDYGRGIAEADGRNMRGATTADFGGPLALFFAAVYRAVCRRGTWVLTEHEQLDQALVPLWRRLIVPLKGPEGRVQRFLVMTVPENEIRAGLDILPDPVFVLDSDRSTIRFANSAAQDLFGGLPMSAHGAPFAEVTGIELKLHKSPIEMVVGRSMHDEVTLGLRNSLLAEFDITVSGAILRGRAYYVVVMRVKLG